ncbi:MAG: flagellar biosynthesis protein FlhF [Comamonadaceae bacterium]
MIVRKFLANSSREALHLVRQGLGSDALILSNRAVEGGIEILAVAQGDLSLQGTPQPSAPDNDQIKAPGWARGAPQVTPAALAAAPIDDAVSSSMVREIRSMRGLIEQHLVFQAWDTVQQRGPGKARLLRDMLHAGFSAALVRQFLAKMPHGLVDDQALNWVKAMLDRNLRTVAATDEIVERGGVYALVGPTGVGKTTTIAKIAARGVVRYGADRLVLLSTDSYRIGAHEQLRIYGKLLGVRVIAVKDASDLQFVLDDLRSKHLVLIDTVGMGQRDQMVTEQHALLSAPGTNVQRLLLLNATGNGATLDDVVRVYRGDGVQGCIITKLDEAVDCATVLDTVIRHQLSLQYVTDGQRVPEDLHLPDRDDLLQRALHPASEPSAHHLDAAECQLMLATAANTGAAVGAHLA